MNELLQKHGCANIFSVPSGLRELMADISREVLRQQPVRLYEFITNYLSVLLITREHGLLVVKILEDLCDCQPSVSEHLMLIGMTKGDAKASAAIIKQAVESSTNEVGKEKLREVEIIQKILDKIALDEVMTAKVCEIVRNAYKDYWYRKKILEQSLKDLPDKPWEIAMQRTLDIYKKTKPSFTELARATERIQAAYRGYYIRKKMLKQLKPKKKRPPKVDSPPVDAAASREIDLGPVMDVKVNLDDVDKMFETVDVQAETFDDDIDEPLLLQIRLRQQSRMMSSKSMNTQLYESHQNRPSSVVEIHALKTQFKVTHEPSSLPEDVDDNTRKKISFGIPKIIDETPKPETTELLEEINVSAISLSNDDDDDDRDDDSKSTPHTFLQTSAVTSDPSTDMDDMTDVSDDQDKRYLMDGGD